MKKPFFGPSKYLFLKLFVLFCFSYLHCMRNTTLITSYHEISSSFPMYFQSILDHTLYYAKWTSRTRNKDVISGKLEMKIVKCYSDNYTVDNYRVITVFPIFTQSTVKASKI